MEKQQKDKIISVMMTVATYVSFCLGYWYYFRGSLALLEAGFQLLSNEIFAALFAGVVPFIVFELISRRFIRSFQQAGLPRPQNAQPYVVNGGYVRKIKVPLGPAASKMLLRLRLTFIAAGIVCFAVSFIYFAYRPLYVWGSVLMNFIITLPFFSGFLAYEVKKMEDKSRAGLFVTAGGVIFMLIYALAAALSLLLAVI